MNPCQLRNSILAFILAIVVTQIESSQIVSKYNPTFNLLFEWIMGIFLYGLMKGNRRLKITGATLSLVFCIVLLSSYAGLETAMTLTYYFIPLSLGILTALIAWSYIGFQQPSK